MTNEEQPKRRPGGQPGNRNALRHGYYSRAFTRDEKKDLRSVADVSGLDEEIALVRHVIKKAAASPDDRHMLIMIRAANVLNRLVRTRYKMEGKQVDFYALGERFREAFFGPDRPDRFFPVFNKPNEADLP